MFTIVLNRSSRSDNDCNRSMTQRVVFVVAPAAAAAALVVVGSKSIPVAVAGGMICCWGSRRCTRSFFRLKDAGLPISIRIVSIRVVIMTIIVLMHLRIFKVVMMTTMTTTTTTFMVVVSPLGAGGAP